MLIQSRSLEQALQCRVALHHRPKCPWMWSDQPGETNQPYYRASLSWWQPRQGAVLAGKVRAIVSCFHCWPVVFVAAVYKLRRSLGYSKMKWEEHSCKELLHQDESWASKPLGSPLQSGHSLYWPSPLLSSLIHPVVPSRGDSLVKVRNLILWLVWSVILIYLYTIVYNTYVINVFILRIYIM